MPQDRVKAIGGGKKLAQAMLCAAFVALVLGAGQSAARAGDDDNESMSDKILRTLGLRALGSTEYELNYSERSPRVVPPTRDLPPPVTANAAPAPNWPKDPDVLGRQPSSKKSDDKPVIRQGDS